MSDDHAQDVVSFLATCSSVSLGEFQLAKLNRRSNGERELFELFKFTNPLSRDSEKKLRELIHTLVSNAAQGEAARILRGSRAKLPTPQPMLIPINWWKWIIRRSDLTTAEKMVALTIKASLNGSGECVIGIPLIATDSGLSGTTVKIALRGLREKGLIQTRRTGRECLIAMDGIRPSDRRNQSIGKTAGTHQLDAGRPSDGRDASRILISENPEVLRSGRDGVGELVRPPDAPLTPQQELRRLELEAEILGRTERLQKASGSGNSKSDELRRELMIGAGPQLSDEQREKLQKRLAERDRKAAQ